MSGKPLILITGATGKTGRPVVEQLIERGYPVRALARTRDQRSQRLAQLGTEVVLGDFHDLRAIRRALAGVRRAYFCYPPQGDRLVEAAAIFAQAAREAGVQAVVNMSQIIARDDAPSPLTRQHYLSEHVLDWADIGAIHIRPGFFSENFEMFAAHTIASQGKIYLPYGDQRHAPIASDDIARVVVALLDDPAPHTGQRYPMTGPAKLTVRQVADILARELGRPVEYVDLPIEAWAEALAQRPDATPFLVTHLKTAARLYRDGAFDIQTDTVERLTGRPPLSFEQWARANRDKFTADHPAPVAAA